MVNITINITIQGTNSVPLDVVPVGLPTEENVTLSTEANVVKNFFIQGGFTEVRESARLKTIHLKALKRHEPIRKMLKDNTGYNQLVELIELLIAWGVTTRGNGGRKLSATFKEAMRG
jgi:hypothetical protein